MNFSAYIGFDYRYPQAYAVTVRSLLEHSSFKFPIYPILLPHMQAMGMYDRPMRVKNKQLYDDISEHQMATEFAISRFFIPLMAKRKGWSLFCDSDFLFREDISKLLKHAQEKYAVMCVKHQYEPDEKTKMQGQVQSKYNRKNWSSLMLINNKHPRHSHLNLSYLNSRPGRDLHAFDWLNDGDIGSLPDEWNWLEGHSSNDIEPAAVHFTRGTPDMKGYEDIPYADEWRDVLREIHICERI